MIVDEDVAWRLFTKGLPFESAEELITKLGDEKLGLAILRMVAIIG